MSNAHPRWGTPVPDPCRPAPGHPRLPKLPAATLMVLLLTVGQGCGKESKDGQAGAAPAAGAATDTGEAKKGTFGTSSAAPTSSMGSIPTRPVARFTVGDRRVDWSREVFEKNFKEFDTYHRILFPTEDAPTHVDFWNFYLAGQEADLAGIVVTVRDIEEKITWAFGQNPDQDYIEQVLAFHGVSREAFRECVRKAVAAEKLIEVYTNNPLFSPSKAFTYYQTLGTSYDVEAVVIDHRDHLGDLPSDVPEDKRFDEAYRRAVSEARTLKKEMIDHVRDLNADALTAIRTETAQRVEAERARLRAAEPDLSGEDLENRLADTIRAADKEERERTVALNTAAGHLGFDHLVKEKGLEVQAQTGIVFRPEAPKNDVVTSGRTRSAPLTGEDIRQFLLSTPTIAQMTVGQIGGVFNDPLGGAAYIVKLKASKVPSLEDYDELGYRQAEATYRTHTRTRHHLVLNFYHLSQRYDLRESLDRPQKPGSAAATDRLRGKKSLGSDPVLDSDPEGTTSNETDDGV